MIEYKFENNKSIYEGLLEENIYTNSTLAGKIITNRVQTKLLSKYLLIFIGFISSLILACFAVLIINGLRFQKKITTD